MKNTSARWFVIYTKARWEKKVAKLLADRGIVVYCPLNKKLKKWSDRHKIVHEPLFRGYVFVQPSDDQKLIVQQVSGVVNFVYWNGKPAVVRPDEIETIQRFLNEFEEVEVEPIDIGVNQRVVVRKGLLINHQGIVLELLGNKVKVLIESMGLKLSATVDKKNLEVI